MDQFYYLMRRIFIQLYVGIFELNWVFKFYFWLKMFLLGRLPYPCLSESQVFVEHPNSWEICLRLGF